MDLSTLLSTLCLNLILAATGTACGSGEIGLPTEPSKSLGEPLELRVGESARIEDTDLSLTFTEVRNDSRCPEDVTCVWAGEATLVFQARLSNGVSGEVTIRVTPKGGEKGGFQEYEIEILKLEPPTHSQRTIEQNEYVATVRVTEITR